jgi:hypothetical protein
MQRHPYRYIFPVERDTDKNCGRSGALPGGGHNYGLEDTGDDGLVLLRDADG